MSRIGNTPVGVPEDVTVTVDGDLVTVEGPNGELDRRLPAGIEAAVEDDEVVFQRASESRKHRSHHGLARSLVANMVTGVTEGFERRLVMQGVGYRAQLRGDDLELQVGFSHPVTVEAPEGITFETPEATRIVVRGADKATVGQLAADIRAVRPPEPYKGKGIRYEDERIRRKAGKAAAR